MDHGSVSGFPSYEQVWIGPTEHQLDDIFDGQKTVKLHWCSSDAVIICQANSLLQEFVEQHPNELTKQQLLDCIEIEDLSQLWVDS